MKRIYCTLLVTAICLFCGFVLWLTVYPHASRQSEDESRSVAKVAVAPLLEGGANGPKMETAGSYTAEIDEESIVEAFDGLTDNWIVPARGGVAIEDVENFVTSLIKVPARRREECLQRAINLIPNENIMLLVGVMMDKSMPMDLVELVYSDILNRSEEVKKPILLQIFNDQTHPCWEDAAWILEATGVIQHKSGTPAPRSTRL